MALLDWKSIFTLFLIILLGWYLLGGQGGQSSQSGKNFIDSLKSKLGGILSSFKLPSILGPANVETGNMIMYLSVSKSLFYNRAFDVQNSSLSGSGLCDLNISDVPLKSQSSQNISIGILSGKVSITDKGNPSIQGSSNGLQMGSTFIPSGDRGFDINVNCVSTSFTVTNILQGQLIFNSASGTAAGDKGTLKLTNDNVEVDGFKGSLQVAGDAINLNGTILKILLNGKEAII